MALSFTPWDQLSEPLKTAAHEKWGGDFLEQYLYHVDRETLYFRRLLPGAAPHPSNAGVGELITEVLITAQGNPLTKKKIAELIGTDVKSVTIWIAQAMNANHAYIKSSPNGFYWNLVGASESEEPTDTSGPTGLTVQMIPRADIMPMASQPRKKFDLAKLKASMREHGFTLSAIVVRRRPETFFLEEDTELRLWNVCKRAADGQVTRVAAHEKKGEATKQLSQIGAPYEIVFGESRWRSAGELAEEGLTGFDEIPCFVRTATDLEVKEQQMVENLARNDLDPVEEAQGYMDLLAFRDAEGKPAHTLDTLAARVGTGTARIRQRLALLYLPPDAKAAVIDGTLPPKTGFLIGSLPTPELREKFAKAVMTPISSIGPLPFRAAKMLRETEFARDLRPAQFSREDAELVPIGTDEMGARVRGGACEDCPMRSGNSPEIYGDVHPNLCMNPSCYAAKESARWERWQAEQTDAAKHRRAVSREELEDVRPVTDGMIELYGKKMVRATDRLPAQLLTEEGASKAPTWKQATKGQEVELLVIPDEKGRPVEYVSLEVATTAAVEAEKVASKGLVKTAAPGPSKENEDQHKSRVMAQQRETMITDRVNEARMAAVIEKASAGKALPPNFWTFVGRILIKTVDEHGDIHDVALRRMPDNEESSLEAVETHFAKLPEHQKVGFCLELVLMCCYQVDRQEWLDHAADMYGVDLKAVKKTVMDEVKKEEKAKAKPSEKVPRESSENADGAPVVAIMAVGTI